MSNKNKAQIRLSRLYKVPDEIKLERFRRVPELGSTILFFSGGTAMRETARQLCKYTHNGVHVMTPFDSGGSSATLRSAFNMPAVGDIRSRIMALADQSVKGNPEIYTLFAYRFVHHSSPKDLRRELADLCQGRHPLIKVVPDPMRKIIRNNLMHFAEAMPKDFCLAGASIGNLVLAGGYLSHRRHLDAVIFIYSKLVGAHGIVRPVVNTAAQLAVRLASGQVIVGQHNFTGKESKPVSSPIKEIWLTNSLEDSTPVNIPIRSKMRDLIAKSDLICYPFGSFYSSLVANLLPSGVGKAVASTNCPKVFVPNLGKDPELLGHSLKKQIEILLFHLSKDNPASKAEDLLNIVVLDTNEAFYNGRIPNKWLNSLGIQIVRTPLVTLESFPYASPDLMAEVLVSLT